MTPVRSRDSSHRLHSDRFFVALKNNPFGNDTIGFVFASREYMCRLSHALMQTTTLSNTSVCEDVCELLATFFRWSSFKLYILKFVNEIEQTEQDAFFFLKE